MRTGSDKKFQRDMDKINQALDLLDSLETDTLSISQPLAQAVAELENTRQVLTVYIDRPDLGVQYNKGTTGSVRVIANRGLRDAGV